MMGFILRAVITAAGLWVATQWVPGVHVDTVTTLLIAAVLLGVVNAIVKPVAFILTLPVTILTLGLFLFVLNAAMVALVAWMLPGLPRHRLHGRVADRDHRVDRELGRLLVHRQAQQVAAALRAFSRARAACAGTAGRPRSRRRRRPATPQVLPAKSSPTSASGKSLPEKATSAAIATPEQALADDQCRRRAARRAACVASGRARARRVAVVQPAGDRAHHHHERALRRQVDAQADGQRREVRARLHAPQHDRPRR